MLLPDDSLNRLVRCPSCAHECPGVATLLPEPDERPERPRPRRRRWVDDVERSAARGVGELYPEPRPGDEGATWVRGRGSRVRRDCEPHRGKLLTGLGVLTTVLAAVGFLTLGLTTLVALPLGLITWRVAAGDLKEIEAGARDPAGEFSTREGRNLARFGAILAAALCALVVLGVGFLILREVLGD
jgi:hypothetical protein